jgi:GntR family transcriptional regulator / MocR family aminotransferase
MATKQAAVDSSPNTMATAFPLSATLDAGSGVPIYRQLAQQLRTAVRSGTLAQGLRLPPSRELAQLLGIGRNSAVQAYADLLAEGWLEARGRLGTFVSQPPGHLPSTKKSTQRANAQILKQVTPQVAPALLGRLARSVPASSVAEPSLDWRVGQVSAQALPLTVWRAACKEAGRHPLPAGYGDPQGALQLRQSIALWMHRHRSVVVDPACIVITQGAGQAIDWLAQLLLQPSDVCAVENPGYPRAARAFTRRGATLRAVQVDDEGMVIAHAFANPAPALLHITPAHQYPLGARLSGPRRQLLIARARQHGSLIIENEYDHEFIHEGLNHAPLLASAPDHVVLVSTFAKAISPSLRLAYVIAPPALADRLAHLVASEQQQVSWPVQISVDWLLRSGELERHLRRVRRHYLALRNHIRQRLQPLEPRFCVRGDAGGLHVVITANQPQRMQQLEKRLTERGVLFDKVAVFAADLAEHQGILLGYGHMNLAQLSTALDHFR